MKRRNFSTFALGCAVGLTALAAAAEAAPLAPTRPATEEGALLHPNAQPAVASSDQVHHVKPEEVNWGHRWHGHGGWRHRHWGWRHHWSWHHHHWRRHRRHWWA